MLNCTVAYFITHNNRSQKAFFKSIHYWVSILFRDYHGAYVKRVHPGQACLIYLSRKAKVLSEQKYNLTQNSIKNIFGEFGLLCPRAEDLCVEKDTQSEECKLKIKERICLSQRHREHREKIIKSLREKKQNFAFLGVLERSGRLIFRAVPRKISKIHFSGVFCGGIIFLFRTFEHLYFEFVSPVKFINHLTGKFRFSDLIGPCGSVKIRGYITL